MKIQSANLWCRACRAPSHVFGCTAGPLVPVQLVDVDFGNGVQLAAYVNLYGCNVGRETRIGAFVEIQQDAVVGALCKISSHSFVCTGVTIEDEVFIGHGVLFCNDRYPNAAAKSWTLEPIRVGKGASIGSGAVILPGVTIGARAVVGAGAVVTHDVPAEETWVGVPARCAVEP